MTFQSMVKETSWFPCKFRMPSQKHRLVEVGGDLWKSSGPSLLITGEQLEATCHHFFNVSKDRVSTTSLGNPCQCLVTLTVKNCFLGFRGRALLQFAHVGSFHVSELWEGSGSVSFAPSFQVFVYSSETPSGHSLFQANQEQLPEPLHF